MKSIATETDFENEVVKAGEPVLVDFWASWCGPCVAVAPVLEELADAKSGSLKVVKLNIDEVPSIAQKFNVQAIPTMILFKNGEVIDRKIGGDTLPGLSKWVDEALAKPPGLNR